jgi:hypothetical protein
MKKAKSAVSEATRKLIEETAEKTARAYGVVAGVSVDYFRATESILFNYKRLRALVLNYDEYADVEIHTRSKSIVFFGGGAYAGEKARADIYEEAQKQRDMTYLRTRAQFEEIDRAIRLFESRKEFAVIRMYYFGEDADGNEREVEERVTWEGIADELSKRGMVSEVKSARRWRNRIVSDMAVCIFGKPAAVSNAVTRLCAIKDLTMTLS